MADNSNGANQEKTMLRPAILADEWSLRFYGSFIRRILVGLTGSVSGIALVGPKCQDTDNILYPSVDFIRHPEIQLKLFSKKNRQILLDKLERFKPTLLHGFWPGDIKLLNLICEELEIPAVISFFQPVPKSVFSELPASACITVPSEKVKMSLAHVKKMQTPAALIPIGTFVEDTASCFGEPERITGIVVCEELVNSHDFEPLLNAVRHLMADGFEFSMAIMGEGPAERPLRKRVRELGLNYAVTIVPPLRPVRPVYQGMDIFIHIKDRGRCNLALLEAMSVGLAVVGCTDSTTDLLHHEKTAVLADPGDEMSLYNGLKRLLSTHELARQLAQNAQQFLRTNHSVSRMVEGYIDTYKMVLEQNA